jgi:hypothetical protein
MFYQPETKGFWILNDFHNVANIDHIGKHVFVFNTGYDPFQNSNFTKVRAVKTQFVPANDEIALFLLRVEPLDHHVKESIGD